MSFPLSGRPQLAFWPFCLGLLCSFSAAQPPQPLRAQGAIALRAILPSVVQVTPATIPVSAQVTASEGGGTEFSFPVALKWNVDRSMRRIQIIALFPDSQKALRDDSGHSIAASQLEVSLEDQTWRPFPARSLHQLPSGVLVISENIDTLGRQGEKLYRMRIRLAEAAKTVLPARYQGILQLQTVVQ